LLAHELVHVVQQAGNGDRNPRAASIEEVESEARFLSARASSRSGPIRVKAQEAPSLRRASFETEEELLRTPEKVPGVLSEKARELRTLGEFLQTTHGLTEDQLMPFFVHGVRLQALELMAAYREKVLATRVATMYGEGETPTAAHEGGRHVAVMQEAMGTLRSVAGVIKDLVDLREDLRARHKDAADLYRRIRTTNWKRLDDHRPLLQEMNDCAQEYLEPEEEDAIAAHLVRADESWLEGNRIASRQELGGAWGKLDAYRKKEIEAASRGLARVYEAYPIFIELDPEALVSEESARGAMSESARLEADLKLRVEAARAFIRLHQHIDEVIRAIHRGSIHPFDLPKAVSAFRETLTPALSAALDAQVKRREVHEFWKGLGLSAITAALCLIPVIGPTATLLADLGLAGVSIKDLMNRALLQEISSEHTEHPLGEFGVGALEVLLVGVGVALSAAGAPALVRRIGREGRAASGALERRIEVGKKRPVAAIGEPGEAAAAARTRATRPELEIEESVERAFAEGRVTSGELTELVPYRGAKKARRVRKQSGRRIEAAHGPPRAAMESVASYDPGAALTRLLPRDVHRSIDRYWQQEARRLAKEGHATWTAQEMFDTLAQSIHRSSLLSYAEKVSHVARLQDEIFVEWALRPSQPVRLPYSR
jgi:hypothetical protein